MAIRRARLAIPHKAAILRVTHSNPAQFSQVLGPERSLAETSGTALKRSGLMQNGETRLKQTVPGESFPEFALCVWPMDAGPCKGLFHARLGQAQDPGNGRDRKAHLIEASDVVQAVHDAVHRITPYVAATQTPEHSPRIVSHRHHR
jgi:hypothetical protein